MKISHFSLLFVTFGILLTSCSKESVNDKDGVIYELTLEENNPLDGYDGYAGQVVESPDDLSGNALLVSGGCIAPHLYRYLGPYEDDMELTFCVEGATVDYGGGVSLSNRESFESISIQISETDWNTYETSETLLLEAGETLSLSFLSGGIVGSSTYFDNLVITAIDAF